MPFQKLGLRDQLTCHKVKELKPLAREKGITPGKLRKDELVDAIHNKMSKNKKVMTIYPKKKKAKS